GFLNLGSHQSGHGASEHLPKPGDVTATIFDLREKLFDYKSDEALEDSWISKERLDQEIAKKIAEHPGDEWAAVDEETLQDFISGDETDISDKIDIPDNFDHGTKHVAIVDDFIHSGITLSHTMNLMKHRNPDALVEGTTFFRARHSTDKKIMPWLQESGVSGVMDKPTESERAFAFPADEELSKVAKAFRKGIEEMTNEYLSR
ncbi:MAG: hypothetical protein ABH846_00580, partial [Patescibacteria group bacterium]